MLIGLYSNQSGAGKDTVGMHLADRWNFEIFSFCSELRRCVAPSFPDAPENYFTSEGFILPDKEWEMSSGFQDQLIARSKEFRPRVLAKSSEYIEKAIAAGRDMVVVDVRRDAEFDVIRSNGGVMVRVHRKSEKCSRPKAKLDGLLDNEIFDWEIHNNAGVEELIDMSNIMLGELISTGFAA